MNKEQQLYDYLIKNHTGKDNAVHSIELEKRFKICPRTLRICIVAYASPVRALFTSPAKSPRRLIVFLTSLGFAAIQ